MQEKFSSRPRNFAGLCDVNDASPAGNVVREIFAVKPRGGGLTKIDLRKTRQNLAKIREESTVLSSR